MTASATQAHYASASLYVGDLNRDVTEAMLFEVFNSVGPVASIRVCRDTSKVKPRSLGYAYVNYHSVTDAERALDTLNYTHIRNSPCRLMWSHRDPSLRKSGTGNVFVKNLDKEIDNKALFDTFSLFGNILSCKVAQDDFGKSRGFGFVHYETEEAASTAISSVNGMVIGRKTVYVGPFKKRTERVQCTDQTYTNLYVKNIPASITEEKLKEIFGAHGTVTSVAIQVDARGRSSAFVNYEEPEHAKLAVEKLHGMDLKKLVGDEDSSFEKKEAGKEGEEKVEGSSENVDGEGEKKEKGDGSSDNPSKLFVARHQPKAERLQYLKNRFVESADQRNKRMGVNLYIKNIHDSVDEGGLRALFEPFGTISSAKLMRDDNGISLGFGFVSFVTADDATKAVTDMHLKLVEGKPLYVGLHEKREERLLKLQMKLRAPSSRIAGAGPRISPHGMAPQIQFGSPNPNAMYYGGGQPGMQPSAGHSMSAYGPGGTNRPVAGGYPGGLPQQSGMMPPWSRGQQSGMRYGQSGVGNMGPSGQVTMGPLGGGGFVPASGNAPHQGHSPVNMGPNATGPLGHPSGSGSGGIARGMNGPSQRSAVGGAMSVSQQKQIIGEQLFPMIASMQPKLAGKITGMMLDMDISELVMLLESPAQLQLKVDEALRVLHQAGTGMAPSSLQTQQPNSSSTGGGAMSNNLPVSGEPEMGGSN